MFDLLHSLPLPDLPSASLWLAYSQSNFMGKSIVVLQFISSIVVWCVMLGKAQELAHTAAVAKRFRQVFDGSNDVLDIHFQRQRHDNPIGVIYHQTCERLLKLFDPETRQHLLGQRAAGLSRALTARELALVKGISEQVLSEQAIRVERGMNTLATATTVAPLVGLLGTVWGVLDAFQAMNVKGSALLSDVAPGISSALLTTVIGLLVAIPSGLGYNTLHGKVRRLTIEMEGFVDELMGRISCEYQGREE